MYFVDRFLCAEIKRSTNYTNSPEKRTAHRPLPLPYCLLPTAFRAANSFSNF